MSFAKKFRGTATGNSKYGRVCKSIDIIPPEVRLTVGALLDSPTFQADRVPHCITKRRNDVYTMIKRSTENQAEGKVKEIKGRIKEGVGKATDRPDIQNEGTADRAEGKVQKKVGQIQKVFGK